MRLTTSHFFFSLSLSEENAFGTPAGGCLPDTSIISPRQATDYWLSAVTQSSARQLLHFKLEKKKKPILVFTHWLVTHGRGRKWKCQRKRRAGGSLITAESSWAAGEQGQQLQGLRKESLQEVTECVDGSVQHANWSLTRLSDSSEVGGKCENSLRHTVDNRFIWPAVVNNNNISEIFQKLV